MTSPAAAEGSVVFFWDTSGLIDLVGLRSRAKKALAARLAAIEGPHEHLYHLLSLAEIATLTHVEVLQSRPPRGGRQAPTTQAHFDRAQTHRTVLAALSAVIDSSSTAWRAIVPFEIKPVLPDYSNFKSLWRQRADHRLLRCTRKDGVFPVATLADHQILTAALELSRAHARLVFVAADNDLLGAAEMLGLEVICTRQPERTVAFDWKDCGLDSACVIGCTDGISDCSLFAGAEARIGVDRSFGE